MKKLWLLPEWCRTAGWLIFAVCAFLGLYLIFIEQYLPLDFQPWRALKANTAIIGTLAGLFMVAFSRERVEDEFINSLRMDAMIKSFILNSIIIVLLSLTMYGFYYVYVLSIAQYFVLLAYIILFRYNMYKYFRNNEE